MPELHIDVTVANRFISSLSKSLQALCHGCMEFDNGIEIVGYININIDSGSKVDYVLNEKVLKSTTNSMTFVSNSFLAKKEQQKQTRDGACSPIPQSQTFPAMPSRMHGAHISSQFHRGATQYSPNSQIPGSLQKRSRVDDFRIASKRHRMHNPAMEAQSFGDQSFLHSQTSSSASHTYSDTSFKQETAFSSAIDNTRQLQINIKKEILEAENQANTEQSNDQTQESLHLQIKHDPDATKSDNNETAPTDNIDNETSENTDLKDTFLEQPSSKDTHLADENISHSESDIQAPGFEQSSESVSTKDQNLMDEENVASTSTANLGDSESGVTADHEPNSDAPLEYDQDGSYSQSAYEDAGEGSSDAGQFEVIEIDDEDEDVQAMFGDSHSANLFLSQRSYHHHNVKHTTTYNDAAASHSRYKEQRKVYFVYDPNNQMYVCPACGKDYKSSSGARLHYKIKHCGAFDHYCQACGKGFQQKSHLKAHMSLHMLQKKFECNICGSQYAHKTSLTAHQKLTHGI